MQVNHGVQVFCLLCNILCSIEMATHSYYLRSKPHGFFSLGLPVRKCTHYDVFTLPKATGPIIEEMKAWHGTQADDDHEGKLGIVNFKEVADYERCFANKVVPSNKQYWADYKVNDMMVMRCGDYHLAVCRILSVATETDSKIQQYLYEGGREGLFYMRLQPIVKLEECKQRTKVTAYFVDNTSSESWERSISRIFSAVHDVVYQEDKKLGMEIPEVMFLYNSWYTANRPQWRVLAFKVMLLMISHLVSPLNVPLSPYMKMTGKLERKFVTEEMVMKCKPSSSL
jgi:hypothetical protein